MLFVIDVGNTQSTLGIYDTRRSCLSVAEGGVAPAAEGMEKPAEKPAGKPLEKPLASWRISTNKKESSDDIRAKLKPLFEMSGYNLNEVDSAAVASVVPALTMQWCNMLRESLGVNPVLCSAEAACACGLFGCDYPNPAEIGADRVADAIAAKRLFGTPVVVVDFGTATNIEVIDRAGNFVGGVIAPGISTGAEALFNNATRLAATALVAPSSVIGKSTEEAMRSGIVLGEAGRIDALLTSVCAELGVSSRADGGECSVVATGGLADIVASHSAQITDVVPELTLEGLRLLATCAQQAKGE